MSFKKVSQIVDNVKFDEEFSVVDTVANLAGNKQFLTGYVDMVNQSDTAQAHIWNALSAVANDMGNTIYTNIQNYVDFVSNVDTCKIIALRSMLDLEGLDYSLFKSIDILPPEILQLLDVLTIDRKILLQSPQMNKLFKRNLMQSVVLSDEFDEFDISAQTSSNIVIDPSRVDNDAYYNYIKSTFGTTISGFLALEYNLTKGQASDHFYIYPTLSSTAEFDSYIIDETRQFKMKNNISPSFDESKIADAIESNSDQLDKYTGAEYDLLVSEFNKRAEKLLASQVKTSSSTGFDSLGESIENKTRYSYYRKRKVQQYVDFINEKYFFDTDLQSKGTTYEHDPNYIELDLSGQKKSVIKNANPVGRPTIDFDFEMISEVADSLTKLAVYITKLRQKIKKQVRKNYMKGTNNLLLYIINQYLLEYGINNKLTNPSLSDVYSNLANSTTKGINVVEYYDKTEYYNLTTDRSKYSARNDTVERFWSLTGDYNSFARDGIAYDCAEIEKFYLNTMLMKNDMSTISSFLDTVYDTGASRSYVDSDTGLFTTKLENGQYSIDSYGDLIALSNNYKSITSLLKFDGITATPLSAAINEAKSNAYDELSTKYLSGITNEYDTYMPQINSMNQALQQLKQTYTTSLFSGQYAQYSELSDPTVPYLYQKLTTIQTSMLTAAKITNTRLHTVVNQLLADLTSTTGISSNVHTVITSLTAGGFVDPREDTLDDEINAVITYMEGKGITARLNDMYTYKSQYQAHVANFQAIYSSSSQTAVATAIQVPATYTVANLTAFKSSITSLDESNLTTLKSIVASLLESYSTQEQQFMTVANTLRTSIGFEYSSLYLESQIAEARTFINTYTARKSKEATTSHEAETAQFNATLAAVTSQISGMMGDDVDFDQAVAIRLAELNFFEDDFYNFKKDIMLTYGGQSFAYYPYLNYKNTTHPSYQIHPYLWNFIERSNVVTTSIAKLFTNVTLDALEFSNLLSSADEYFGRCGQSIDIWKHFGALDYTGYTTDYEYSKHNSSRSALTSEVVDYDGPFYPPAVEMLQKDYDACISSLSARTGEFYERFYRPLAFTDQELAYTVSQFEEYWKNVDSKPYITTISSIVQDRALTSVYDIYRYGKDKFGNSYTLYKQYFTEEPTYKEKKNTLGELWIRLKDQPISFPAFSGSFPVFDMTTENSIPEGIQKISRVKIDPEIPPVIANRMRYFFDFELSESKTMLALVMLNRDAKPGIYEDSTGYDLTKEDNSYLSCYKMDYINGYENAWVMCAPLTKKTISGRGAMVYAYNATNRLQTTKSSFVKSGWCTETKPTAKTNFRTGMPYGTSNYAFLGMYSTESSGFNLVYVLKTYFGDLGYRIASSANENCKIIKMSMTGTNYAFAVGQKPVEFPEDLYSDDICFAYDEQSGSIVFAVLTQLGASGRYQTDTSSFVDLSTNTDGAVFNDPRRDLEMNSHDIFESNVTLIKVIPDGGDLYAKSSKYDTYNMNADMAYRPAYPGLSGEFHHRESISSMIPTTIELLGKSKSLAPQVDLIDPGADPYFDVEKMYSEYRFGRVYEDYINEDNSLKIVSNPLITDVVREPALTRGLTAYQLDVDTTSFGYSRHNYDTTKLLFFNTKTSGKNPYMINDLTSIYVDAVSSEVWYDTMYNEAISGDLRSETNMSSTSFDVTIAGTYSGMKRNAYDSNYIFNIDDIKVRFVKEASTFQIKFIIADPKFIEYTHIEEDDLKMVFFNTCDLRVFKYYHFLDAYGAANAKSAKFDINMTREIEAEPWRVVYNRETTHERDLTTIIGDISSYYLYKNSEYMLADVDLREYDYLSDVYILQTSDRLSFKIDEDDFWPLSSKTYYYPCLNVKYPKVLADYINDFNPYKALYGKTKSFMRALGEQNTFILDLVDPDEVKGKLLDVQIPILRPAEEAYLVYENFLEKDDNGFYNYKKYATNDIRNLPYMQCTELNDSDLVDSLISGALSSLSSNYTTIPVFLDKLALSCPDVSILKTNQDVEYASTEFIHVTSQLSDINIDDFVKLYVNYARSEEGIDLYFNYYNYIDSPYVKIHENKIYCDTIPGTYLSVAPNSSGFLNIVAQVRYYTMEELYGYTNITLMTYQIFNVSDDKPKFIIRRAATLPDQTFNDARHAFVRFDLDNAYINLAAPAFTSDDPDNAKCSVDIDIHIKPTTALSSDFDFQLVYPSDMLDLESASMSNYQYIIKDYGTTKNEGYIQIHAIKSSLRDLTLSFTTKLTVSQLQIYKDQKFLIYIDEMDVYDSYGAKLSAVTEDAYMSFDTEMAQLVDLAHPKPKVTQVMVTDTGKLVTIN